MTCKPCISSLESAADCWPTSSSDTRQLSLLNGKPTPAKSCANEPKKDGSPDCTCGKEISGCSIHPNTPDEWIASMRDSLAKTLALLENRKAYLREQDQVFTVKYCVLLASFDRATCSWRTLQQSFLTDSEPFSATWPRWGMTQGGYAYAHPMSERRITETDGSCWPTPDTRGFVNEGSLSMLSKMCDSREEYSAMGYRAAATKKAKYWPTPTKSDYKGSGPTMVRSDGKMRGDRLDYATERNMDGSSTGGKLNPEFVAWLMGFPIGWANSKAMETRKYRFKPQPPGDCSAENEMEIAA